MKPSFHYLSTLILLLPFLSFASADASSGADSSLEMICHGDLCYPLNFIATNEFQVIHPDQNIPPGLHIRLNMETGVREGKLNIPGEGEEFEGVLVALPEGGGAEVVDFSDEDDVKKKDLPPEKTPNVRFQDKSGDNVDGWGAVKPPLNAAQDTLTFSDSIAIVLDHPNFSTTRITEALATLEPLVHEIYWGLQLAVPKTVSALLNIILTSTQPQLRSSAALVLGGAISNNPKALKSAITTTQGEDEVRLIETLLASLKGERDDVARGRMMFALSQGVKSKKTYGDFVKVRGLELLRELWDGTTADGGEFRGKVSTFVEDNFLNEDMKAEEPEKKDGKKGSEAPKFSGAINQKPIGKQSSEAIVSEETLKSFCEAFQSALTSSHTTTPVTSDEAKSKILSALAALRRTLGTQACPLPESFKKWYREQLPPKGMTTEMLEDQGEWFQILAVELENDILKKT